MTKLSHAIANGDGISILVQVDDAKTADAAERQGADGLVAGAGAPAVRASSELPLLFLGGTVEGGGLAVDAIVIPPDLALWDEAHALGLECVVRVTRPSELARALDHFDPEMFLLSGASDEEPDDALGTLLALLPDVPAGKLVIAELPDATAEDVAELERAGVDAVLVATEDVRALVPSSPPEV